MSTCCCLSFSSHGLHSCRSKLGVSGIGVHQHGSKILKAGFSLRKCSDVCGFEVDWTDKEHVASLQASNEQLISLSGGLIPKLSGMRIVSVGGAHTNSFLRAAKARCTTPVAFLQGANGLLDPDALGAGRPAFRQALHEGMNWTVLDSRLFKHVSKLDFFVIDFLCLDFRVAFMTIVTDIFACRLEGAIPGFVHFLQNTLNVQSHNEKSEIELILDMMQQVETCMHQGTDPDWEQIEAAASIGDSPATKYIKILSAYLKCMPHELIDELAIHYKSFGQEESAERFMGSEFVTKLAALSFGKFDKFPLLQNAMWKANLIAAGPKLVDGVCKLIPLSALSSLTGAAVRDKVKEAEKIMKLARNLVKQLQLPADTVSMLIGNLDIRVALHMCKLGKYMDKDLKDLTEITKVHLTHSLC